MTGAWTMTEDGRLELAEPYANILLEAELAATAGWRDGLIGALDGRCPYTREELCAELVRRCKADGGADSREMTRSFVIQALEGDLLRASA